MRLPADVLWSLYRFVVRGLDRALAVCHNRRISQHHVFRDLAQRGKTSLGWFYGFK
jgi:uncharacterized membrane protein YsdA (DUF1294 family)